MPACCQKLAAFLLALLPLAHAQEDAAARALALRGVAPYAELEALGLPLPPAVAEVAAMPASRRMVEQRALKLVWLERLIRARAERNRVSRDNLAHAARQAAQLGAPPAFTEALRRQSARELPYRERHLLDDVVQTTLDAYGVDARELRYFVESCGLSESELREVVAWLPLPGVFNTALPAAPLSAREVGVHYAELLAARRELTAAWQGVTDLETADAAAEALLPVVLRHHSALRHLLAVPMEHRSPEMLAPLARVAGPINADYRREHTRMKDNGFFGSARLQALDYLLH